MTEQTKQRTCLACGQPLQGRVDKKYCDDYCRNTYNNRQKATTSNLIRNVNNALRKNRKVLESLLPEGEGMTKCHRSKLLEKGFFFKYVTHTYTTRKGHVYNFCYDHGYLLLENDWILIVRKREE